MLSPGSRLGVYEVESLVGAGGMGEVYRCRDTRLDRTVAIKVLPQVASDPQARERFEREARMISQLDHPHICALHDIGRYEDIDYLVLEFLRGETLAHRLSKGALPLEEALKIAFEIADALEAAHRQHTVHRDLKPGNVMLTKSGAKLLDFGLAKAASGLGAAPAGVSMPPTEAAPLTAQGTILGTLQYMAPEQIEGRETDARTDIFSFGAMLYEMVTGQRAFTGKSQASLIAAILEHEPPPIATVQPLAPPLLDRVVRRCLDKDPDKRWQSVQDVALALGWVEEQRTLASPPRVAQGRAGSRLATGVLALWAIAASALAIVLWTTGRTVPSAVAPIVRFAVTDPPGLSLAGGMPTFAIAGDGSAFVYLAMNKGIRQLYVRRLNESASSALAGTENATGPLVSPDGNWVAFTQGPRMRRVSLAGGAPVTICEMGAARGATWAADDTIVFSSTTDSGLWRVPVAGGVPVAVTRPDGSKGERSHRWPHMLPDGQTVMYTVAKSDILSFDDAVIAVRNLTTGATKDLVRGGSYPLYTPTGHLVYSRSGTVAAVPFDVNRLEITGAASTILNDVVTYPITGAAQIALSSTGVLVSMAGGATRQHSAVMLVDRNGQGAEIAFPAGLVQRFKLAPDGRSIALDIDNANASIWIGDLARATATRLTLAWSNNNPVWAPDGSRIAFNSGRGGARNLFWQAIDATEPEQLTHSDHNQVVTSWSADGRHIAFNDQGATAARDIFVLDLQEDRKERPLIQTTFDEFGAEFSPNGNWIAYVSDEGGQPEVYIQSFPDLKRKTRISRDGGIFPIWAKDSSELLYRNGDAIMAADLVTAPLFSVGAPRLLFRRMSQYLSFDVTTDGRFVIIEDRDSPLTAKSLTVTMNWSASLGRRN